MIQFQKPKKQRFYRYGWAVMTSRQTKTIGGAYDVIATRVIVKGKLKTKVRWITDVELRHIIESNQHFVHHSNTAKCKTLRAFRRMLRKNPHINGHSIWQNKYVGYSAYA